LISTNYANLDFKPFDCQEKVKEFIALLKYPEVQNFLKLFIDSSIATSELEILQRLTALEDSRAEARIEENKPLEQIPLPETKTELRACKVAEKLKGKKFLSSREIVNYLKYEIEDKLKVKEGTNVRQTKKEVLEKVIKLFPNTFLDKKKCGRREVRLVFGT